MEIKTGFKKRDILRHFLSAGINITPKALSILASKSLSNNDLGELIRKVSYLPDFKLHLTESILNQTEFLSNPASNSEHPPIETSKENNQDQSDLEEEFPEYSVEPNFEVKSKNSNNDITSATELAEDLIESELFVPEPQHPSNEDIIRELKTSNSSKSSGGMSRFKPIAKDYAEQIEILQDPNTNLYTTGSIDDFIAQFRDRFERLSEILLQNPEVKNVIPINEAKSLHSSGTVNIIGMVTDKSPSRGGHAIKFSLDDQTEEIDVVVRNDDRNVKTYESMIYLVKDEVVFVSGFLKVDMSYGSRVLFANKIIWPDIPMGNKTHIPSCPVSFALLSDLHIGSDNFLENVFTRFTRYLNGEIGTERDQEEAGKIKYVIVCGDLVDGIGIYADQVNELEITDIYKQYEKAAELFSKIPDYVKIIYIPGNHEPVRKAIPHPAVPSKYCKSFLDLGVTSLGDPSMIELHGIQFLLYHGDGIIDMNNNIPGLLSNKPTHTMKEFLRCRHLSPTFGKEHTEKAPTAIDWLVVDQIPHVFHTGHMHINDLGHYRNVLLVNSGCFQAQTKFMKSLGINPTPGKVPIISEKYGKLDTITLTLM
ncbi:MAG: hypothetical protein EU530_05090 [Promethearchaeota archaeon]|nr:MAG: hypothetical protein EU530_05090 [Candidatus Lokiarchaeota archaeon]